MPAVVCWIVILIIVIIVVVCIVLRIWYALPCEAISAVINAYDIVGDFSRDKAKYLKSLLDIPHIESYRIFHMEEVNIITVRDKVKLSDELVKELIRKRTVIVCDISSFKHANAMADKLVEINAPVSLIVFGQDEVEVDGRIHLIRVTSDSIDISSGSRGSSRSKSSQIVHSS